MGGLHDYIRSLDRDTLVVFALTAEKYYRNKKNIRLMGGLHDRVAGMTEEDLVTYILAKIKEFPELDSKKKLTQLAVQYGLKTEEPVLGGLHDYIFREPRETLIKWAFTAEKYHRKVNNQEGLLGGLDDYIGRLSTAEIAQYILKEAAEHSELNSGDKLNKMATELGVQGGEGPEVFVEVMGGLHDYIYRTDRKTLEKWAFVCQRFDRESRGKLGLIGGLEDYIGSLSDKEVADYILAKASKYSQLNSSEKLNTLATKYSVGN